MKHCNSPSVFRKAHLSRDPRFDGLFFIAVKTTGVYCRPICPATTPKEQNVLYFENAAAAGNAGFRPCLRCRPDSAPGSNAWLGTTTTFNRAIRLIEEGVLQDGSLSGLAERLGITDRYLRQLFKTNLGISPKRYALYQQCLFAKKLLHQSSLPIMDIAIASGFNSQRRFNDCFKSTMGLTPSKVRKESEYKHTGQLSLELNFRPPFNWTHLYNFLAQRKIDQLEWCEQNAYGRTIELGQTRGHFEISHQAPHNHLQLTMQLNQWHDLKRIIYRIRKLFDLDAPIDQIDRQLKPLCPANFRYQAGIRLPGIWNTFEAGVRAILGQQVTVAQATWLVSTLVRHLGAPYERGKKLFPAAKTVAHSDLDFLGMPRSRKQTLRFFSLWYDQAEQPDTLQQWRSIKGIGPWTINYVKMRAHQEPDVWLEKDAGIARVQSHFVQAPNPLHAAPWRSYLTLHYWNQLL